MKNTTLALLALVLMACGSSTPPSSTHDEPAPSTTDDEPTPSTTDDEPAPETCAGHGPNDSCMNEENFAACQAREAECPGQVIINESCPLRFACP